jgi:hypothetical protein
MTREVRGGSDNGRFWKADAAAHHPLRRILLDGKLDGVLRFAGDANPDVTDGLEEAVHGLVAATEANVDEDQRLVRGNTRPKGALGGKIVEHHADQVVRRVDHRAQDVRDLSRELGLHLRVEGGLLLYDDDRHSLLHSLSWGF